MVIIRALLDGSTPLSRLDSGLSIATSGICLALGLWFGTVLLVAGGARLAANRRGRAHRCLDRALGVLAPGLAGRVLRATVGLGGIATGVLGSGLLSPVTSSAATAAPSPLPALAAPTARLTPDPVASVSPAVRHPEPPGRSTDLWPLSTRAPEHVAPLVEVVVHRGDTLWSIAARQLPATAAVQRIDALWRSWYERNRAVIGPDPDLLLPGQVLRAPL